MTAFKGGGVGHQSLSQLRRRCNLTNAEIPFSFHFSVVRTESKWFTKSEQATFGCELNSFIIANIPRVQSPSMLVVSKTLY